MEKEKNCLLLVPSLMTRNTLITYTVKEEHRIYSYEGRQTNEAVAKYLMESLRNQGEGLSKMIMLCSPEVKGNVLDIAGGRTTYEYLKDELGAFYKEIYFEDMPGDFFVPIEYKNQADENVENIMAKLEKVLCIQGQKANLYVDFTGGIRSAAMALVFICRILNEQNVETKKILYSNISEGSGMIEDCTGTYNLFLMIEGWHDKEKQKEYLETIKEIPQEVIDGFSKVAEEKKIAEINNDAEGYKNSLQRQQKQEEKLAEIKNPLAIKAVYKEQKNRSKVSEKENGELLLLKNFLQCKQYDKALNFFRQRFVSEILLKENIIKVKPGLSESDLSDEVLAAYRYYENYSNKGIMQFCFLSEMKKYVEWLGDSRNHGRSPKVVADRKFGDRFYNLETRKEKEWIRNFGVNDVASWDIVCEKIKPYIREKFEKTGDIEEYMTLFKRLFRLYTTTGYPFECVFKNKVFAGYAELYEGIRKRGVDVLEALYEGKNSEKVDALFAILKISPCPYKVFINRLNEAGNEWMLTKIFPFSFRPDYIGMGSALTQEWGTFSYQLAKSFFTVNRVRNQQTHDGARVKTQEMHRAVEEVEKLVRILIP